METLDDSHIPDEVLEHYARHGLPKNAPQISNHLIACDSCNDVYERELTFKSNLVKIRALPERTAPQTRTEFFTFPKPVWAAAGALLMLIFMTPYVQQHTGAAQVIHIAAIRGGQTVQARSNVPLVLRLDTAGLDVPSHVRVDVVNDRGTAVWRGPAQQVDLTWQAETANGLRRGRYWVRIPDPGRPGELLREFQLDVQ